MNVLLWAAIGYLAGALPFAWIVASMTGNADALRRAARGAGETDAHLVLKEAGAGRAAAIAGFGDVMKAFVPTLIAVLVTGPYSIAACAIAAVAGHCWPPVHREAAGRGLSAAAGGFLAFLPFEMVVGGAVTGLGNLGGHGGLASSVGFALIPIVAILRGQPSPYPFAAWVVLAVIVARRLEGVSDDLDAGVSPIRAVVRRVVFDVSARRDREPEGTG